MPYDLLVIIMIILSLFCLRKFAVFIKTFEGLAANNIVKSSLKMLVFVGYFGLMVVAYLIMFTSGLTTFSSFVKTLIVLLHTAISIVFTTYILRKYGSRNQ